MNEYLHVFQNYIYIYYLHTGNDFFQVDPLWANISEKICRQCARILLQAPGSDLGIAVNIKIFEALLTYHVHAMSSGKESQSKSN
jgi:hypothetical protein